MDKLSLKRKYMYRMLWKSDRTLELVSHHLYLEASTTQKKPVETMQVQKRGVKINGKTVYDLEAVFVPPSLIDEYDCMINRSKALRKGLLGMHALSGSDSLRSQWKRKGVRPASIHSNGN